MTTLSWPSLTITPVRADWNLVSVTQIHESPLTGAVQTQELPGAYWQCVLDYSNARGDNARLLWAFVAQMRGRAGRVAVPSFGRDRPAGVGGGAPLVAGGGQTGNTLAIDGAPISITGWLLAGDIFSVGGYLYMLTADATTSGGGAATLSIAPSLRAAPADNAALTLVRPTTTMMFLADEQGSTYTPGGMQPFVFTLREAFP
jgi:hypothetical protein